MAPVPLSSFILGNDHLSLESVGLGRLVKNKRKPQDDYYAACPAIPIKVNDKEYKDIASHTAGTRDAGFIQRFMEYVSLSLTMQRSRVSRIRSDCLKEYILDNSGEYFRTLIKQTEARKWIETAYSGSKEVCLLVGYKTLRDAVITEYDKQVNSADMGVRVREISVEGGVNWGMDDSTSSRGVASGEQVFAVLYRKVKVKYHSLQKRELQDPLLALNESKWTILTADRDPELETTETVDVLEAEITESKERDEFDLDDDEDDEEQTPWTKVDDKEGDFYL